MVSSSTEIPSKVDKDISTYQPVRHYSDQANRISVKSNDIHKREFPVDIFKPDQHLS